MIIPALHGSSGPNPWGQVIGAADPAAGNGPLSVKAYVVSGQTVWGSYQSPITDQVLRDLKGQVNRFLAAYGKPTLSTDGLIGPKTVAAIQDIANRYSADPRAIAMRGTAGGVEQVARNARSLTNVLWNLAQAYNIHATVPAPTTPSPTTPSNGGGGGGSLTVQPPDTLVDTTTTTVKPPPSGLPTWSWYAGGGILFAGLVAATIIVWRK